MLFTIRTILLISEDTKSGRLQDRHDKTAMIRVLPVNMSNWNWLGPSVAKQDMIFTFGILDKVCLICMWKKALKLKVFRL